MSACRSCSACSLLLLECHLRWVDDVRVCSRGNVNVNNDRATFDLHRRDRECSPRRRIILDEIGGALRRFGLESRLDGLAGDVKELARLHRRVPDGEAYDSLTLRSVHGGVSITVPAGRAAHRLVLVVQLLEQE